MQELGGLSVDDASSYMRELMGIFVSSPAAEGGDEADADRAGGHLLGTKRSPLWALEQAVGLWPRLPRESQAELLKFLVLHAYYEADPDAPAPVSRKTPAKRGKKASAAAAGGVVEGDWRRSARRAPRDGPARRARRARQRCSRRTSRRNARLRRRRRSARRRTARRRTRRWTPRRRRSPADLLSAAAELRRRLDEENSGAKLVDPMPEECEEVRARLFAALDRAAKAGDDAPRWRRWRRSSARSPCSR